MLNKGYLKLFRKIEKWEWIDDIYVTYAFIRILLKANYENKVWHGLTIKRGQFVTSRRSLAKELNFTEQTLRTVLNKLESTKEIEISSTQRYTLVTVVNYDLYQSDKEKVTQDQPNFNPISNPTDIKKTTQEVTKKQNSESLDNTDIDSSSIEEATQLVTQETLNNQPKNVINSNSNIRINNIYKLNYTKLNLLFNYLIYKNKGNFENLNEVDREAICFTLKRLELLISPDLLKYYNEEQLLELKIKYWTITELYLNPDKMYLNKLSYSNFTFKFLKAKKYIKIEKEEDLSDFVGYFITCLREVMQTDEEDV